MAVEKNDRRPAQRDDGKAAGTQDEAARVRPAAQPVTPIKKKKRSKKPLIIIILVLLLVIAIGVFVYAMLQFTNFPPRNAILNAAYKLDPRYESFESRLAELEAREAGIAARESAAQAKEESAAAADERVRQREADLADTERDLTPIWRLPLSEQDLLDMQSLAKIFSQMDPDRAALILATLYDMQDMAAIIYHMSERNAAAILAVMDPALAARITNILLHE